MRSVRDRAARQRRRALLAALGLGLALPVAAALGNGELQHRPGRAARALPAPKLQTPADSADVDAAPAFTWRSARRAESYEFQLAADPRFRSIVDKGSFDTRNTAATIPGSLPDGAYYWRVRGVSAGGDAGRWSRSRSLTKRWSERPNLVAPSEGAEISYPGTPLVLSWDAVPHAARYRLTIANDSSLASPVIGSAAKPVETSGTVFALEGALEPGSYWWAVTPVDAAGHPGTRSTVASFGWSWPTGTTTRVGDLNPNPLVPDPGQQVNDPQFSWDRVPGAARYEVEVSSSASFAVGSKVCCADKTIGTSLSPAQLFESNLHYWRVRALDISGNAGAWNVGPSFQKVFDAVPGGVPSVPGLHLRDNVSSSLGLGASTSAPILVWDPAHGASSYELRVVPYEFGGCNWAAGGSASWTSQTATTAWTPLASAATSPVPPSDGLTSESDRLVAGKSYCARVRARTGTDTGGDRVVSDWTQLGGLGGPAFTYVSPGPPTTGPLTAGAGDYLLPQSGASEGGMPLFAWKHVAGACGYFVVVAKDADFTTIVDVARTRIPAYAPRKASSARTYPDETTLYYWAVMPVDGTPACDDVFTTPQDNNPHDFHKQSTPPAPLGPGPGEAVDDQPTFRWTSTPGARDYRLQVSHDPSFGNLIDDVKTASTAYTSSSTYPADAELYWRVWAGDENGVGLTWSATRSFRRRLAVPQLGDNPTGGETMPSFGWLPVPGAVSYDVHVDQPDGTRKDFNGVRGTVFTPVKAYGLGIWRWQVRANFPSSSSGVASSGFTGPQPFRRFINPPTGAHSTHSARQLVLRWDPSFALAKEYRVEFSESSSFTRLIDSATVENTAYAPRLSQSGFLDGGPIHWRVAAVDEGNNVGGWATGTVRLLRRMVVRASGQVAVGHRGVLTVSVANARGRGLRRARVTVRGAGIRARSGRTGRRGAAKFRVRPRSRGSISVRVDKRGFRPGSARLTVG